MALAFIPEDPDSLPAQLAETPRRLGHGWSPPHLGLRLVEASLSPQPLPLCSTPPCLTSCGDKLHPGLQSQGERPTYLGKAMRAEPGSVYSAGSRQAVCGHLLPSAGQF